MIKKAGLGKEIVVRVINKIGILADLSKILADHGINIEAVAGYTVNDTNEAEITLVTEDNLRASDALGKNNYKVREKEVVILELENKAGVLKNITSKLAQEGIDIKYIYGTTCPGNCPARMVLSTSNNEKTLVIFTQ